MKKIYLLATLLLLSATTTIASDDNYDWIQTTLSITYAEDGTTEQSRVETTYDVEGRQIGYKQYSNGELIMELRDYQYNGRTATYWYDYYSSGSLQWTLKNQSTYSERNWIQTTLGITYAEDGITEQSRIETSYDTEGRQIGYKQYSSGELIMEFRDYQYNGRTATYWYDYYSGGSLQWTLKNKTTYSEKNWIQTTLGITYAEDGTTEQSRIETNYDTEGRQISYKQYSNGELIMELRDYQYNGRTATYWYDYYSGGNLQWSLKNNTTYKEQSNTSEVTNLLENSIFIYPNPTNEELSIENDSFTIENVEIYDINGKTILSTNKPIINISHLLTGTYFVKIKTDNGELIKKIIKK